MKKSHLLRTVLLSTVLALLAVFLIAPVASAHTTAPAHGAVTATSQVPATPNVDIVTKNGRSEFSESSVDCHFHSAQQPCFQITNLTHKPQEVDNGAHTVGTVQPGQVILVTAPGPGIYPVSLAVNDQAMLTVTVS